MNNLYIFAGFLFLYFILPLLIGKPKADKVSVIAHRGGAAHNPENTMRAFKEAAQDGSDGIEFDIQMTKDGKLVVIHDSTVDRTTNGSGEVKQLPANVIRQLNAGMGEKVPTFREVVKFGKENNLILFAEAKSPSKYPGLEALMVEEIKDNDYAKSTVFQSFDTKSVAGFNQIDSKLALAQLYGLWQFRIKKPQPGNAKTASLMAEMIILFPWMIFNAHRKGYEAVVWFGVLKGEMIMRWIMRLGADGLIVDDHKKLLKILDR